MEINWGQELIQLLRTLLPALFALGGAYLVFRHVHRQNELRTRNELRVQAFSQYVPLRIAAHERLMLYLDRIQPESLLLRNHPTEHSSRMLEALMLREAQIEFEHNTVQQLYLDQDTWRMIVNAKNEILQIIQRSAKQLGDEASGIQLAEQIAREISGKEDGLLLDKAVMALKYDVQHYFN